VSGRSSARSYSYHPLGATDLLEATEYLSLHAADGVAADFEAEVAAAIERLLQYPEIGVVIGEREGLRFRKWKLKRFRYSLVYLVVGNEIRLYAVAHHSRKPEYWLDRLIEL